MTPCTPALLFIAALFSSVGCQFVSVADESCPNGCSGNGICDKQLTCHCYDGFFGYDCSLEYCPVGKSWGVIRGTDDAHRPEECSGRGICLYSSGSCSCQSGFTGPACQFTQCLDSCSNHGKCISMKTLSENEVVARELYDREAYVYNQIWDFDVIHGCQCDVGFHGPSCSLKNCPVGDDPLTTGQANEMQLIQCLTTYQKQTVVLQMDAPLTKGKFILRFGKQYTRPISFKARADQDSFGPSIATSLLALRGVDAVTVTRADPLLTRTEWTVTFPTTNMKQHNALVPGWRTVEVQQFICAADSGVFAVTFGNETIRNIPSNADSNTFVAFLSKLSFYGQISVSLMTHTGAATNNVCTTGGTFVTMTFSTLWHRMLLADLPPMTFSTLDLKGVQTLFLGNANGFVDAETKEVVKGHDSCRVTEEQQFLCGATGGNFALTFEDGTKITGLPYSITADTLKATIQTKVSYIVDIDVTFADGQSTFCSDFGTTIIIRFVVVKATSGDGDLAEIQADQTNNGGSDGLVHIANRLQFPSSFTETEKGSSCEPLDQTFSPDPARQMQTPVELGGGSLTITFRGATTRPIPAQSTMQQLKVLLLELPTIQGIDVSFSGYQMCEAPANLARLTFTQNFGNLPTIVIQDSEMSAGSSVVVAGGGNDISSIVSVDGTKESEVCSNRGYCDEIALGRCICHTGYTNSDGNGSISTLKFNRGDCGATSRIPVGCPGDLACSGHGTCSGSPSYRCSCAKGWRGGDCSERACPVGYSWFDYPSEDNVAHQLRTECSAVGDCDRSSGKCKCQSPYTGGACDLMACGGSDVECNGFTYGEDPNDVATWDAHRIRSCLCDPFYFGYDCSQKECPRGDGFNTDNDDIERQLIQCIADAGSFTLTFRDETTKDIPYNSVEADIKSALEELSTIGEVEVVFSGGTVACSNSINIVIMVDFLTDLGDLPSLSGSNALLQDRINGTARDGSGSLVVVMGGDTLLGETSVKGTRENALCSNHGICDFTTGICICHANYGGSDGKGGPGTIANCGFHELKYAR
ncbi:tenascin-like protein [Phytophthora infestans T30-4]|uniref:Tenascin-like protein n=1 Tax=Phytophthora infestans (strain T30-4) TaxID=403677 RepID=D0NLJ4_PHYIT|nr:tenascin-like protein [Phytophthora infestans T30-4]EEY60541.1 tenascin-like protein [Phytophthora infestans T30-4]|eukprot:XP_002899914.1 tenascin-like protein [Phytophthora infestans T30-4]